MNQIRHSELLRHPDAPKADFGPIRQVLGELMPELMLGPRGRHRLTLALTQRFGENFRMNTQAQAVVRHFDEQEHTARSWLHNKGVSHGQ